MSSTAVPKSARSRRRMSSTWAWIVTSRAVVGSSAMSNRGLQAIAIAIMTRCRMPPESWCGYSSIRLAAAGTRTRSRSSIARDRASRRDKCWWRRSTSPICLPTVKTGFSEVMGSWNTMEMSRPRISRSCRGLSVSSSRPSSRTEPDTLAPCGCRPKTDSAVIVLPQPDSPTMAKTSPCRIRNDRPSTARTGPSSVSNRTLRSAISSSGPDMIGAVMASCSSGRVRRGRRHRTG